MVKLSEVVSWGATCSALKSKVTAGGAMTVNVAFVEVPAPASFELKLKLFVFVPAITPVTFTRIVQELLAGTVPPDRVIAVAPGAAVAEPPQVLSMPGVLDTTSPAGSGSLKANPVTVVEGITLLIAIVSVV